MVQQIFNFPLLSLTYPHNSSAACLEANGSIRDTIGQTVQQLFDFPLLSLRNVCWSQRFNLLHDRSNGSTDIRPFIFKVTVCKLSLSPKWMTLTFDLQGHPRSNLKVALDCQGMTSYWSPCSHMGLTHPVWSQNAFANVDKNPRWRPDAILHRRRNLIGVLNSHGMVS